MCLSVYLGTITPLEIPSDVALGSLGIELAIWTPPPLRRNHKFTYYLGRKGVGTALECSCLLAEYVNWDEAGPTISVDELYPEDGPCPFESLRAYCALATVGGGFATIVCDDSGGAAQDCSEEDYCRGGMVLLEHIQRGRLLFAEASGGIPWRAIHVVNTNRS